MSKRLACIVIALAASATVMACTQRGPQPFIPFAQHIAVVPDSLDRALLQMELWRTRYGLSECLVDTTDDGIEARVGLFALDLFISAYGSVDSVRAWSPRADDRMTTCVRDVVRTWILGEQDAARRYRFTLPMSARLADADLGGPLFVGDGDGRHVMRSVMTMLWTSGQTLAECYVMARPVTFPVGGNNPDGGGLVVVRFAVNGDGTPHDISVVESTIREPGLDSCLVRAIANWRLPRGESGVYEFPITFSPEQSPVSTAATFSEPSRSSN